MHGEITEKSDLVELCRNTLALSPNTIPPDQEIDPGYGQPKWYQFEHEAWAFGEQARQAFSHNRSWKRDPQLQLTVLEVATRRHLRRGRQSWVMALGFTAARQQAPALVEYLADPDVDGHVLDTLLKMRVGDFAAQVWPLTRHEQTWVRKLARRYLSRYAAA